MSQGPGLGYYNFITGVLEGASRRVITFVEDMYSVSGTTFFYVIFDQLGILVPRNVPISQDSASHTFDFTSNYTFDSASHTFDFKPNYTFDSASHTFNFKSNYTFA